MVTIFTMWKVKLSLFQYKSKQLMHRQSQRLLMLIITPHLNCTLKYHHPEWCNNERSIIVNQTLSLSISTIGGKNSHNNYRGQIICTISISHEKLYCFTSYLWDHHTDFPQSCSPITENWDFSHSREGFHLDSGLPVLKLEQSKANQDSWPT